MRRILVGFMLTVAFFGLTITVPFARPTSAVDSMTNTGTIVLQSDADAAWEGLDGTEQHAIEAIGLTGAPLDQLVVDYDNSKHAAVGLEGSWSSRIEQDNDGTWGVYLVPNELPHTL